MQLEFRIYVFVFTFVIAIFNFYFVFSSLFCLYISNLIIQMAQLTSSAADDVLGDMDLLCDVADSSLLDIPANVGESYDFSDWLYDPENDSLTIDSHNESNEYTQQRNVLDAAVAKSVGLSLRNRGTSAHDGLQRNMSKNAVLARENREKKKRYIQGLERTVHDLSVRNRKLVHTCRAMRSTIAGLNREVCYLRGVIENQSELARLLKHIPIACPKQQLQESVDLSQCIDESETINTSSYKDQLSFSSGLKSSESAHAELMSVVEGESLLTEHDYARSEKQNKKINLSHHQFGVCLHVANQVTSLQLCAVCNDNAQ